MEASLLFALTVGKRSIGGNEKAKVKEKTSCHCHISIDTDL
jgi:hypothetical protein